MLQKHSSFICFLLRIVLSGCLVVAATPVEDAQAATGMWTAIPNMNHGRFGHTATRLADGKVLVVGGSLDISISTEEDPEQQTAAQTAELFDPSTPETPWSFTVSLIVPRMSHTATLIGERVLVAGGTNGASTQGLASAEIYDPTGGPGGVPAWLPAGDMSQPHINATATRLADGRVLVAGGYSGSIESGTATAAVEVFNPDDGTWTSVEPMNHARVYHSAALLQDGQVLVVGGSTAPMFGSGESLGSAEIYDPAEDTWTDIPNLNQARSGNTATLLENGTVLVAGGYFPVEGEEQDPLEAYLSSAEIYDPALNTWTPTGSMTMPREHHTATLLESGPQQGKVLVAGGANISPVIMAELFDPTAGTWLSAGDLQSPTGHIQHAAEFLANGEVLVTGGFLGFDTTGSLEDSFAEVYTPKFPQSITVTTHAPESAAYNTSFTVAATTSSGLEVTYSSGSPQVCTNVGAQFTMVSGTGICIVRYHQAGDGTYDAAPTVVEHVAAQRIAQSITFDLSGLEAKTFGDPPFTITATSDVSLPITFTPNAGGPCSISEVQHSGSHETNATVTLTGAGDCNITASQGGDDNYLAADPVSQTVAVAKASQVIEFQESGEKPYGQDFITSAMADSGLPVAFTPGDEAVCSVVETWQDPLGPDPTRTYATIRPTGLGSCTIIASHPGNDDYLAAESEFQTVSIIRGSQTIPIRPDVPASARFLEIFSIASTATSGLPVAYSSESPQVCIVNKLGTVTMLRGSGTCTVRLDQEGNEFYNPANSVTYSISAMKALQAITLGPIPDRMTFGDQDVSVTAASDSGLPVRLSLTAGDPCTLVGGKLHILHAGACTIAAEQDGNEYYEAAETVRHTVTIDKKTIAILLEGLTRTVDGKARPVTVIPEVSGLAVIIEYQGMGTTLYGPSAAAPAQVGVYRVRVTIDDPDYQGSAEGTLTIEPARIYLPAVQS